MATSHDTSNIPYGYCHCGCGQKTNISKKNDPKNGIKRGQPRTFIHGHQTSKIPIETRFWSKVAITPDVDKCWEWQAGLNEYGYGSISDRPKLKKAHRVAWELTYGAIPDGLQVLHKCDNRKCCNPRHLFLGTHLNNMEDMVKKGRQSAPIGEQNAKHKLTKSQVIEIRQRYVEGGISITKLGNEYGITRQSTSAIVLRRTWKHV